MNAASQNRQCASFSYCVAQMTSHHQCPCCPFRLWFIPRKREFWKIFAVFQEDDVMYTSLFARGLYYHPLPVPPYTLHCMHCAIHVTQLYLSTVPTIPFHTHSTLPPYTVHRTHCTHPPYPPHPSTVPTAPLHRTQRTHRTPGTVPTVPPAPYYRTPPIVPRTQPTVLPDSTRTAHASKKHMFSYVLNLDKCKCDYFQIAIGISWNISGKDRVEVPADNRIAFDVFQKEIITPNAPITSG